MKKYEDNMFGNADKPTIYEVDEFEEIEQNSKINKAFLKLVDIGYEYVDGEWVSAKFGCHCDLAVDEERMKCVLESDYYVYGDDDCVFAQKIEKKEQCKYWRRVK